jgi:hypothetical protein
MSHVIRTQYPPDPEPNPSRHYCRECGADPTRQAHARICAARPEEK